MGQIQINNLSYTYPGAAAPVFENVTLSLDTGWRLGLIGRNGRGKTTLLRLLAGELDSQGSIAGGKKFSYFPERVNTAGTALEVAKHSVAPFSEWEAEMQALVAEPTAQNLEKYGELEEQYARLGGYTIEEELKAEAGKLGIQQEVLERPYSTLSGGEKIKLLLAAQFLKRDIFLLIDEPTDHLDAEGRAVVSAWLAGKSGFILTSHDRAFMDRSVEYILSINKADIELQKGNYSSWKENRQARDAFEAAENDKLKKSIQRLEESARQASRWSDKVEKTKYQSSRNKAGMPEFVDRGFIGHKSAKMMQRSKAIETRKTAEAEKAKGLLHNLEEQETVFFHCLKPEKNRLVTVDSLGISFGDKQLFSGVSFEISAGDRIAVCGGNGCGKTSLMRAVTGVIAPAAGSVKMAPWVRYSTVLQETGDLRGGLLEYAGQKGLDVSLFLTLLRKLNFEREAFEREIQHYSAGQKKKVELAASLSTPCHLFVWDEPLNYIDIASREQLEEAILLSEPTMLFVEHDQEFARRAATKFLQL